MAMRMARGFASLEFPSTYTMLRDSLIVFLDLAIEQACRHLPLFPLAPSFLEPIPKMSGEGVEVRIEAIAGRDRQTERRPTVRARGG